MHWIHNCASCLGLASPMDGTDKMQVEFGDEKKQRENIHHEASISHADLVDVQDQYVQ